MSSQLSSANPLALFLKPLSPVDRLAAQQRDHEKLQRERQLRELAEEARGKGKGRGCDEARGAPVHAAPTSLFLFPHLRLPLCVAIAACEPLTSLSLLLSTVQHQHQPQLRPLQQISVAVHRQHSQGFSISKVNSRLGPPNVPSNSKFSPQTPLRIETEN